MIGNINVEDCMPIWSASTPSPKMEKFSASDRLSQTNNVREIGLIQSKRIIRTIYGWWLVPAVQIHTGNAPLTTPSMPRKKMICFPGWTLNMWIKLKLNCVYGSQTPTIAMKNLWILFRSKYKRYQLSIIETLMDRIEFKLANQGQRVFLLQNSQMLLRYGTNWRANLDG